ncbi:MAG: endonuclease/exonuclease/phosphatase family protein [Chloroflexi bacterium]|nr:endonuclease/exonuclease/phosphatase family protein [Chloroflexota bacterium]
MSLSIVTWNVKWATPRAWSRTPEILVRIKTYAPEVVCLTESHADLLSPKGHTICSQPDAGYGVKGARRKVVLWSEEPWEHIDHKGSASLPPGRFVSGVTRTSLGLVKVVGVCIPWFGSRTESHREADRRERWEDHEQYLAGLTKVLAEDSELPIIVIGDYNQRIGAGRWVPKKLQEALQDAFPRGMTIATDALTFEERRTIDHIAVSGDLAAESVKAISNIHEPCRLSDHFGVAARLSATPT